MVLTHFRFTNESVEELEGVVMWLRSEGKLYLCSMEISKSEKRHIHALIDVNNLSTSGQRFHKHFLNKYKGNKCISWTTLKEDMDANLRYISKGKKDEMPVIMYAAPDLNVTAYWNDYWVENAKVMANKEKTDTKKARRTIPFMEQIILEFRTKYGNQKFDYVEKDMMFICQFVMKRLGKANKILDSMIVKRMCMGLLNAVNPDSKLIPFVFEDAFKDLKTGPHQWVSCEMEKKIDT